MTNGRHAGLPVCDLGVSPVPHSDAGASCRGTRLAALPGFAHVFYTAKQFELKRPRWSCTVPRSAAALRKRANQRVFPRMNVDIAASLQVSLCIEGNTVTPHRPPAQLVSEALNMSGHSPGHLPAISNQATSTSQPAAASSSSLIVCSPTRYLLWLSLRPGLWASGQHFNFFFFFSNFIAFFFQSKQNVFASDS